MKTILPVASFIVLVVGAVLAIFVAKAPDDRLPKLMRDGKGRIAFWASIAASVFLLSFKPVTGKDFEEIVGCSLLFFTDECRKQAEDDLVKTMTGGAPRVVGGTPGARPGENARSAQEIRAIQVENCGKARTPEPPRSPVIDINRIYPGMPLNDALEVLRCLHPDEDVTVQGSFASSPGGQSVRLGKAILQYRIMKGDVRGAAGRFELTYDDLGPAREVLAIEYQHHYGDDDPRTSDGTRKAIKDKYGDKTTFDGLYVYNASGELQGEMAIGPRVGAGALSPDDARLLRASKTWSDTLQSCRKLELPGGSDQDPQDVCGFAVSYSVRPGGMNIESIGNAVARRTLPANAKKLGRGTPDQKPIF